MFEERDGRCFIDGEEVSRRLYDMLRTGQPPGINANTPSCWPQTSMALSVHPDQAQEFYEASVARGVPTEFKQMGDVAAPVFMDRSHRRQYCQEHGYFDRDAGYADAQRGSAKIDRPDAPDPKKESIL